MPVSTIEAIDRVKAYIAAKGFRYDEGCVENFFLCLKSKPFVILAGTSGTGKTRLTRLFAEAIGAEYKLIPVRPDWSDSSCLFGHVDLNGHFQPGPILPFIKAASEQPQKPFILCLDEMNLARVEYYFSDVLSVMETRQLVGDSIVSDRLIDLDSYGSDTEQRERFGALGFPQNLYLVGTVNMDESTFSFSKKVLDRANTIEFNYVDLLPVYDPAGTVPDTLALPNSFLRSDCLQLSHCSGSSEYISQVCAELQLINRILKKANAHIGYRSRDEIVFYMLNNRDEGGLLPEETAFDHAVMQKILPRIQGSSVLIRDMLLEFFLAFCGDYSRQDGETDSEKMRSLLSKSPEAVRHPLCAEKLEMMVRRFEDDGFTSFWL